MSNETSPYLKADDIRYWLDAFHSKEIHHTHQYESFKFDYDRNRFLTMKKDDEIIKVYSPELFIIFTSDKLQATNMDTKEDVEINGVPYRNYYIEAYEEGRRYFDENFAASSEIIYGKNAEQYVKDIHNNYFHIPITERSTNEGWSYVKGAYPVLLTFKAIKDFGYYSGIVSRVEEIARKHPELFKAFDKCNNDLLTKSNIDKKELSDNPYKTIFKNKAINESVNYWVSANPYYTKVINMFEPFIKLVDVISKINKISSIKTENFIAGLMLYPLLMKGADNDKIKEQFKSLTKPMFDEITTYLNSNDWKRYLIDSGIIDYALEIQLRDNVKGKIPLSTALLKYINQKDLLPISGKDISQIEKDFLDDLEREKKKTYIQENEPDLSMNQIALIYAYKNEIITRDNGSEIAKQYGYLAKTSGEKLYQNFSRYYSSSNRKGDEGTKRKNQNKIKLIESIIHLLPEEQQKRAIDEVNIIKNIQKTEYS